MIIDATTLEVKKEELAKFAEVLHAVADIPRKHFEVEPKLTWYHRKIEKLFS